MGSMFERRDGCRRVGFRDGNLLLVEACNVGAEWLGSMFEDFKEVVRILLQAPAVGELLHEFVAKGCEGPYGSGGNIDVSLKGMTGQSQTEALAHGWFP